MTGSTERATSPMDEETTGTSRQPRIERPSAARQDSKRSMAPMATGSIRTLDPHLFGLVEALEREGTDAHELDPDALPVHRHQRVAGARVAVLRPADRAGIHEMDPVDLTMPGSVGVTERAVQRIIDNLEAEGYISRFRDGRKNRYEIHRERPMRHPALAGRTVGDLLAALVVGE